MIVIVIVIMVVIIVVVVVSGVAIPFDRVYPGCGSRDLVEVEHPSVENLVQVDFTVITLEDGDLRIQRLDDAADSAQFLRLHFGSLVQKDYVAELDLLDHKVLKIVLLKVVLLQGISAGEFALHSQGIHDRHDAIQHRDVGACPGRHEAWERTDCLGYRGRLAYSAGLDDDVVEAARAAKVVELGDQVHLERAADAAVLKRHKAVVACTHDSAFLDEVGIDVHLADVVHDDRELDAFPVVQYPVEQCSLAASEITGQKEHGNFPVFNCHCHKLQAVFLDSGDANLTNKSVTSIL